MGMALAIQHIDELSYSYDKTNSLYVSLILPVLYCVQNAEFENYCQLSLIRQTRKLSFLKITCYLLK